MRTFFTKFRLEIVAFTLGMTVLAFELTAARIAAPYLGSTIYTWTSIIGVILVAGNTAPGSQAIKEISDRNPEFKNILESEVNLSANPELVLTDDFAPVERLGL